MQLAVDLLERPIGVSDWLSAVSSKLTWSHREKSWDELRSFLTKPGLWAREAERTALQRAESATGASLDLANKLAARHHGVGQGYHLMQRNLPSGIEKSASAVRPDAGDYTCVTWLCKEASKRIAKLRPVVNAAVACGYFVSTGRTGVISRSELAETIKLLKQISSVGLDIQIVPASPTDADLVVIHFILMTVEQPSTVISAFTLTEASETWPDVHHQTWQTAESFGAANWVNLYLDSRGGKRLRTRVTVGIFYNSNGKEIIARADRGTQRKMEPALRTQSAEVTANVNSALSVVEDAKRAGDVTAAVRALNLAKAYVEDFSAVLLSDIHLSAEDASIAIAQLQSLTSINLHGMKDYAQLEASHLALMFRLAELPQPAPRIDPPAWRRVGYASNITDAMNWVRGKSN